MSFKDKLKEKIGRLDQGQLSALLLESLDREASLEKMIQDLPFGVIAVDPKGKVEFSNQHAQTLLGIGMSEGGAENLLKLMPDSSLGCYLADILASGKYLYFEPMQIMLPHAKYLSIAVQPQFTSGKLARTLIIALDTEELLGEERKRSRLEKTESILSLARGVAHEVGNPLNAASIHLRLIDDLLQTRDALDVPKIQDYLSTVQEEIKRLDRLVRNFLRATRMSPPRFSLEDVEALISKGIEIYLPELNTRHIELIRTNQSAMPLILLDPEKILQVIHNLIRNAIDAMPEGGQLRFRTCLTGHLCVIEISDTGLGIAEEDLPHVLEAYYSTKEEGGGLGLLVVHEIIRQHGGRIEILSRENQGTMMRLYLPLRCEVKHLPSETGNVT